jgi:hypothetical protein
MGSPLLLLVDYRRAFWSSTRNLNSRCSLMSKGFEPS